MHLVFGDVQDIDNIMTNKSIAKAVWTERAIENARKRQGECEMMWHEENGTQYFVKAEYFPVTALVHHTPYITYSQKQG